MTAPADPPPAPTLPAVRWILAGLQLLLDDLRAAQKQGESTNRAIATAKELGLGQLPDDVMAAIEAAIAEIEPMRGMFAGPVAPEVRFLAESGALRMVADAHRLIARELAAAEGRAQLAGLAEALSLVATTAGNGFRRRAADKLRGLYVIIDPELTNGRDPVWIAEQAIAGGATALQLRDKTRDKGDGLQLAQDLANICRSADVTLLINDHPDVALALGAHGVHLGQHDLPVHAARQVLVPWQIAGTSNALVAEAQASYEHGADYIAVGRMFETTSKANTRPAGPETLRKVRETVPADGPPIVGIGGITTENIAQVAAAGADGICVISAVTQADNPKAAAAALLEAFRASK
ncbi:MAG: thiamine phosphate synthase [Dehalococcoidia bacterium]